MADITVNFINNNKGITIKGFGIPLVISTVKDVDYKIVNIEDGLGEIGKELEAGTEAYKLCTAISMQEPKPSSIAIFGTDLTTEDGKAKSKSKSERLEKALTELINQHGEFYRIVLDDKTDELKKVVANFSEANEKVFYTVLNKDNKIDLSGNSRSYAIYKENEDRIDGGIVGFASPRIAGSFTLKFKEINGATADNISESKVAELKTKNINSYVKHFGSAELTEALATNGAFIDQIESRDYIKTQIISEIAILLKNKEKIPYDNEGIAMIRNCIVKALNNATNEGIIAKENGKSLYKIEYKTIDQIPATDRSKRKISGIKFTYVEAGAIHEVAITGIVTAQL